MEHMKGLKAVPARFIHKGEHDEHSKVSKAGALYLHRTGTQYQCKDCIMFMPATSERTGRCWIHPAGADIKPNATCGLFVKGKPSPMFKDREPIGAVSKLESGYDDSSPEGFSCKRCEYFLAAASDCKRVDKSSPGDDPDEIHPDACCNNFEKK